MTCLKLPRGRVTTSLVEMRSHAMDLYVDLFEAEQCSMEFREELLERLLQVSPEEKELNLKELTVAVNQMASGRAPGIDSLNTYFYKHF